MSTEIDELKKRVASLEKEFRAVFGKAETVEPAPGSDAEHPPVGYVLVPRGSGEVIAADWIVWSFDRGPWKPLQPDSVGDRMHGGFHPMARPTPANDGDSRLAESVAIPVEPERVFVPVPSSQWIPGVPPKPYSEEWFFAKLDKGGIVALKALPDGWSYDFTTVDETYFAKDRIAGWMQNPNSEYIAFGHDIATTPTEPARGLSAEVERLEAELDTTKRFLAESLVERDRLKNLHDARKVRIEGFRDILRERLGDLV